MHPLITRYLDVSAARETLQKHQAGETLGSEERLFAETAEAHPEHRANVQGGKAKRALSSDAQASLVFLAAHAAARSIREEPALAAAVTKAREALKNQGASPEETEAFVASILLEEAFGYEEEVDTFDADFVKETLGEVPALAALTREKLEVMMSSYLSAAPSDKERAVRTQVAHRLVDIAWSEGPTPINPEHMEALLEDLEKSSGEGSEEERESGLRATVALLEAFAREGLIGPQRLSRLRAQLGDEDA